MPNTKQKNNMSSQQNKFNKIIKLLSTLLINTLDAFKNYFNKAVLSITNLPAWVKNRPASIKKWLREDRKKKKYRSFRLQKRIKPEPRYIPSAGTLMKQSLQFLWNFRRTFVAIFLINLVIYFAFIKAPVQGQDIQSIRDTVKTALGEGSENSVKGNLATLGAVLGTSSGQSNSTVTTISVFMMSLIYIWAIRQLANKQKITARDAYYQGLTPIIPVTLILIVISLQLIPFAAASFVYSIARSGGLFATGFEDLSFFIITLLIGLASLFMITSSVMALFIASLPGMYPLKALRAAKKIVQFQRLKVFRRIVALPVVLGIIYILGLLLTIRFIPNQTFLLAEIAQLLILPFVLTYLYKLYRSLI